MAKKCRACGGEIYTYNPGMNRGIVTLARAWTHYSWWANMTHVAVP